jgi:hypothetical protein
VNHRRSVDNCNGVKTEDSTTPRDKSSGNLKVGLTASGIEVARPSCRHGYGTWETCRLDAKGDAQAENP